MRKIKGLRWYMIALVTLGTVLGYLTRNTVAAAAPTLMEELHISTQQYSYIIAAYSAAYTVMQPVAGYVLDVLASMHDEIVRVELNDQLSPGLVRPNDDASYTCVVMPMRI